MEQARADWVLASDARSVTRARTLIAQRLIGLPDESVEVVLLLVSELVTNAVRHGSGPVGLHVAWGNGTVRVEVHDQSPEWPVVRAVDRDALDGRGLILVDGLATGWGVMAGKPGKTVWFTAKA
ncbi:ATP-binding protein [Nocardioides panacis]|jgi:anti-sigma regulatory factor (Ser/Thr protein kinase)|uniref:ATP-binding protein n=1 Tax=Nocardioides panacis TaxID=2849501 RepID=A0A975T1U0_9ACTN|nr:ATP-binding protein [Nocardioides panacis]QWZ10093.1 ATP-binding protein [Nocardioides panacis]